MLNPAPREPLAAPPARVPEDWTALLDEAKRRGATLWAADEKLHFRAPEGALDDAFLAALKQHRDTLVEALSGPRFTKGTPAPTSPVLCYYHGHWRNMGRGPLGVSFTNSTHFVGRHRDGLDVARLRDSVRALVCRHRILGCAVIDAHAGPRFAFTDVPPVALRVVDLRACAPAERDALATSGAGELVWRPFSAREALFRPFVIRVTDQECIVGFVVHHFIADMASVMHLARDLAQAYEGIAMSDVYQYVDYVEAVNRWHTAGIAAAFRLRQWREKFSGAAPTRLPVDRMPDPHVPSRVEFHGFQLDGAAVQAMDSLAAQSGVTPFVVCLALHVAAIARAAGTGDVTITIIHDGRDDSRLRGMVGSTQNQIPIRMSWLPSMSVLDLLAETQHACLEAYARQVPYAYLSDVLRETGDGTVSPELNFLDFRTAAPAEMLTRFEPMKIAAPAAHDLTVRELPAHAMQVQVVRGRMLCGIRYLHALYDRARIVAFGDSFARLFEWAARDPRAPFSSWT
jgi:hypothetical protein